MRFFLILALSFVALKTKPQTLFSEVIKEQTGIEFINMVVDNDTANIFLYSAFYNGGGVAIADINNDGLPDIYFGGNQAPDALYLNKGNMQFEDITLPAGILNKGGWTAGVNMVDINQDGLMDIYVCKTLYDDYPELRKNELYINNGDLTFTELADEYGLGDIWRSQQASFFDYDRDGDLDVFIVNQPPNPGFLSPLKPYDWRNPMLAGKLMKNDEGFYRDVTQTVGVYDKGYPLSAMVADYNNDNWPDMYVTNDYNSPDKLYINQKDGTFENTIDKSMGHISYFSMGCDAADINNDGLIDQVVVDMVAEDNYRVKANMSGMNPKAFWNTVETGGHYQYMLNTLHVNVGQDREGVVRFSEVSQLANVAYTDWSWSPLLADFDNDGNKDLIITNGLLRDIRNNDANRQVQNYLKPYIQLIDSYVADPKSINIWDHISLDTLLGFYPTVPLSNYAFNNKGNYNFENATDKWGLNNKGFTVGSAYADLDLDGDLDIVFNNINAVASVYQNNASQLNKNKSLTIELKTPKGLSVYGTKIKVIANETTVFQELSNARGFYSSSDVVQVIGVGKNIYKATVEISWGNGQKTIIKNVNTSDRLIVDYDKSKKIDFEELAKPIYLLEKSNKFKEISHKENEYDDYKKEVLLPHKMSDIGPKIAYSSKHNLLFMPGALGCSGKIFDITKSDSSLIFETNSEPEEVAGLFVDLNNDGFEDLVVVPGGNERSLANDDYKTHIYLNRNNEFSLWETEFENVSGQVVLASDFDFDGDMDLFIGGRQIPGRYPKPANSYIYKNLFAEDGDLSFKNVTSEMCPSLSEIGLVTDGIWQDIDGDSDVDLILVGEWMPITVFINQDGVLKNESINLGLENTEGWWSTIGIDDLDKDGDLDILLGNLGTNYKFKASEKEPFRIYYSDYDANGSNDIVLSYYNEGKEFPVRGRECSAQQVPDIKRNFKDYNSFASSSLNDIYGIEILEKSYQLKSVLFESVILENMSNKKYKIKKLPIEAQFSSINAFELFDLDSNGLDDIIYGGNKYGSEIETPRADASYGGVLLNNGNLNFSSLNPSSSGLFLEGEIKDMVIIQLEKSSHLLAFPNNANVINYSIIEKSR